MRFVLVFVLLLVTSWSSAQLYTFRNYNHRDGLAMESTLSSYQDNKGYLWVGTDGSGLMRFDGTKFSDAGPSGKSYQYHVSSIFAKTDGVVYFTSQYEGVFKLENGQYRFVYKPASSDGDAREISMIDSSIVLTTDYSIGIFSESGRVTRKLKFKLPAPIKIYQLLKIPQGIILLSSAGNYLIKSGKITPLSQWYKPFSDRKFKPRIATFKRNKLSFYDGSISRRLELVLNNDGTIFSGKITNHPFANKLPENEAIKRVAERQNIAYIITESDEIYKLAHGQLKHIVRNYSGSLGTITSTNVDQNGDLWINNTRGFLKVSLEPFTRIDLNPMYLDKNICLIHQTKDNILLLGNTNKELRITKLYSQETPILLNVGVYQIQESTFGTYLATSEGIQELVGKTLRPTKFPYQEGKKISLIHWDGTSFWYSPYGEGLIQYNPTTKKTKVYKQISFEFPTHFYTAQDNYDHSIVFFGSNNGIYSFDKKQGKFKFLSNFKKLGSYCGNSTVDRYGTCWFTLDKGLAGITNSGAFVSIDDDAILPSTLFYTFNSDLYGNLIAGTNKGMNIIEVDRNGKVITQHNYSHKEGFGGYETHMRAQFQLNNYTYVGTIEGLYLINTEILRNFPPPPAPFVSIGRNSTAIDNIQTTDEVHYRFNCLLPKSSAVMYSYRLIGVTTSWSFYSSKNEIDISELNNGRYTLEVRASYDGIRSSPISRQTIIVQMPLWQTKWFIVVIIIVLGLVNIAYLEWSKSYQKNNIFNTKDITIDIKIIPRIILFGLIVNGVMLILMRSIDDSTPGLNTLNIIVTSLLLVLFLLSRFTVHTINHSRASKFIFYTVYSVWIIEYVYLVYLTSLHPFPVFFITMATSVLPYILSNIRWVVVVCLFQLFLASTLLIWIENPQLNELFFIAAVAVSGGLAVMVTYLRNDSLEKLIFVSGIINKGNVIAIAFNQKGIITYCSENSFDYFGADSSSFIGKPSSALNPYVVTAEMRNLNVRDEFVDGRVLLIPMFGVDQEVKWIEWSCKYFNDSVMVILGQDVTDKLTLSTNYQTLVENAQDMIYNVDVDGNFIFANERCIQVFGYSADTLIGKLSLSLIAPQHRDRVTEFYKAQFKNRIHHTYCEFPIKPKSGREFWVGQNVSMIYEPGSRKRISGFIALARDITEKRANELLIEQQNKDITASINYAKRIQINLLPEQSKFQPYFDQSFILFKPKEIISGDFYWMERIENKLIIVVADCTGHGVPGAFMTILGINLLNQIVRERRQHEPHVILNELNKELHAILPQKEGTWYDGMDAIVAVFEEQELCFASSGVAFIHATENELQVHRPHRLNAELLDIYDQQCIRLLPDDSFYFFTDGFQQQFGSIKSKKFSFTRMEELLQKVKQESMPLQRKYFENSFANWSEGYEQTDDITIIGLRGFSLKNEEQSSEN